MNMEIQLTIMGSFLSLILIVNAFFTRKTLEKMSEMELKLAVLISRHDNNEVRSKDSELEIKNEIKSIKERIIFIEGRKSRFMGESKKQL